MASMICAPEMSIPRWNRDGCLRVLLPDHGNNLIQLLLGELQVLLSTIHLALSI